MDGASPVRILLFRHGMVDGAKGVFYSQRDVPLSRQGEKQVHAWCARLEDLDVAAVYSSDLSRCLFQAQAMGRVWGRKVRALRELREVHFGEWTGLSWDDIEKRYPGWMARRMEDLAGFRPPGGENLEDVRQRALGALMSIVEKHGGKTVAVVSHGGVNRVILASIIGLPLGNIFSLGQDFACLNLLDFYPDGYSVLQALNITLSHYPGLCTRNFTESTALSRT